MKIKKGTILNGLKLPMRKVLIEADRIWKKHGQELAVTCGLDSTHSAGSLHYYGYALDLRTYYFTGAQATKISEELKESLGQDYDVIVHKTHIHTEFDKILKE